MKRARYLTVRIGTTAPYRARIKTIGDREGLEPDIETDLASLEDVRGFLEVVRPISYVEEVAWDVKGDAPNINVLSGPIESLGELISRALVDLGRPIATARLVLAEIERSDLEARIAAWRKTSAK